MKQRGIPRDAGRRRRGFLSVVACLAAFAVAGAVWIATREDPSGPLASGPASADAKSHRRKATAGNAGKNLAGRGPGTGSLPEEAGGQSGVETGGAELRELLTAGGESVEGMTRKVRGMRGISLSAEEREAACRFLEGKDLPEGFGGGSFHWLADEVLTTLRLQEPTWKGLAGGLSEAAFRPETDPMIRDYIMQHLGHLWEQEGASNEIDQALWRAVGSSDATTPGTALIALSRGYARDRDQDAVGRVRQRAAELVRDRNAPLAVKVTALSIAAEGGGPEVRQLASGLIQNEGTPVILKIIAERLLQ